MICLIYLIGLMMLDLLGDAWQEAALQIEYRLVAFIEKQVENAHVGQETMLLLIHLIIALRNEICIRKRQIGRASCRERV